MPYKNKTDWRQWYDEPSNQVRRRERNRRCIASLYKERRAAIDAIKIASGCIDCGYRKHPSALQFDHVDPAQKSFSISKKWNKPWPALLKEIAKCVVRCANCHAVRTVIEGHAKN